MRLGHYEVLSPLGAGGMGEVFRARDSALGREVAIKVLPIYLRENAEALARFEREAKAVAALSHPNILAIHEFGSPDGRWVLALTPDARPRILLHPTGPGQTREIPNPESVDFLGMKWLPDGRIVAFGASKSRMRGSVIDPADGSHRTFTEEGVEPVRYWSIPVSPDGARVVARDAQGRVHAYPVDGGAPAPIDGLSPLDIPLEWSSDGRALFVARSGEVPWRIRRRELTGGRETPWTEIEPAHPGGIRLSQVFITPDGRYWVHGYSRLLTDLYVAEGLR
jgi:hypothetical protein